MKSLIPSEKIEKHIYLLRGQKVMLDRDLAELYRVPTKAFNQAVKRHKKRFPPDFMFRLSKAELELWRSQIVTSNPTAKMGLRRPPYAFTEHGILMLSSVLNSERAVQVNIEIMRSFVRLRQMMASHKDLARRLDALESKYDAKFRVVFDAIRELMEPPEHPRKSIGFQPKS
ncbi:MAG: DNA-binding protein [Elusimicrobia bacterium CG_4_9_14_3_um_filter_62_55]|nr:MAG: DNA-binding protein [Elusimicrobia bacterium CG22_combo_CG10-13_8_21_14_all_63_91]PJA13334.1 MAG: DNA-binding protein [Elusimicrobia bacterium CG_4_10_14_0_2_um_filter_63_34]PJB26112.1 MAG: DNA-binding protein [Elusimicrobia bacterium CG_4_9_14_3_um_filter_62_55]